MRVNGVIKRAKVAAVLLFGWNQHVRIMQCERCGSINIGKVKEICHKRNTEDIDKDFVELGVKAEYQEIAICKDCGSSVVEKQWWQWQTEEEVKK